MGKSRLAALSVEFVVVFQYNQLVFLKQHQDALSARLSLLLPGIVLERHWDIEPLPEQDHTLPIL